MFCGVLHCAPVFILCLPKPSPFTVITSVGAGQVQRYHVEYSSIAKYNSMHLLWAMLAQVVSV